MLKTIKIYAKCHNLFDLKGFNESGKKIINYSGYIPTIIDKDSNGEELELEIEVETGKIINWKPFTKEEFEKSIEDELEDELDEDEIYEREQEKIKKQKMKIEMDKDDAELEELLKNLYKK